MAISSNDGSDAQLFSFVYDLAQSHTQNSLCMNAHLNMGDDIEKQHHMRATAITSHACSTSIERHQDGLRSSVPKLSTLAQQYCTS